MAYFADITEVDDLKARYKELAKTLHPDTGGDVDAFREMLEEYTQKLEELTSVPSFLKEEYIGLGRALCGIAREKRPEQFAKVTTAAKGLSLLLSLSGNKRVKDIRTFIDKTLEENE